MRWAAGRLTLLLLLQLAAPTGAGAQTLTAPVSVAAGGTLAVRWSDLTSPTTRDWIGLFAVGAANTAYLDWVYTNGQFSGQVSCPIAAPRAPGTYELRLLRNDGSTQAAMGPSVTVTGRAPLPPPPAPAGTLTLSSSALTWGSVPLTATRREELRFLTITNDGAAPVTVTPGAPVGAAEFRLKSPASPLTLKPQQTAFLAYGFMPTAPGQRQATAALVTTAGPLVVPLTGAGIAPPPPGPVSQSARRGSAGARRTAGSGAVGPDAPLTVAEAAAFTRRITVGAKTNLGVQAACDQASQAGGGVVFLPTGTYLFSGTVTVPAQVALLGAGSATVLKASAWNVYMFAATGDQVRFSRLKFSGWTTAWTNGSAAPGAYNASRGIQASGKNIHIDHCDFSGFDMALLFYGEATALVDGCTFRQNRVIGGGYGVSLYLGAWVRAVDNEFSDCRHMLASNGDINHSGTRPAAWEFVRNHVFNLEPSSRQQSAVDTHSAFDGSFLVEGNRFDAHPKEAIGILAGSGLIAGNQFSGMPIGVRFLSTSENGVIGVPHDVRIEGNQFSGSFASKYVIAAASRNIVIDGVLVQSSAARPAPPRRARRPAPAGSSADHGRLK
jgi:pectate lyase-like protein